MSQATPQSPGKPSWLWLAGLVIVAVLGLVAFVVGQVIRSDNDQPTTAVPTDTYLREMGANYSAGYIEGAKIPFEDIADEMYGHCVSQAQLVLIPRYGDSGAQAWLVGCLTYARNVLPPVEPT